MLRARAFGNLCFELARDLRQLLGALDHTAFEFVVELLDFLLGLFQFRCFDDLPLPLAPCKGELVSVGHIQKVDRPALEHRISAQKDHGVSGDGVIDFALVLAKLCPIVRSYPKRVSAHPDSLATLCERFAKFAVPSIDNSLRIEPVVFEIPLPPRKNLDSTFGQIAIELWNGAR